MAVIVLAYVSPSLASFLRDDNTFALGQFVGIALGMLQMLSSRGRRDLDDDFRTSVADHRLFGPEEPGSVEGTSRPDAAPAAVVDDEVINLYSEALQARTSMFGREADLPFEKERIRSALLRASTRAEYASGDQAVSVALTSLDTFLPEGELDPTVEAFRRLRELKSVDDATFERAIEDLPSAQRRAIMAVLGTLHASAVRPTD
jgi:hypothetical protein